MHLYCISHSRSSLTSPASVLNPLLCPLSVVLSFRDFGCQYYCDRQTLANTSKWTATQRGELNGLSLSSLFLTLSHIFLTHTHTLPLSPLSLSLSLSPLSSLSLLSLSPLYLSLYLSPHHNHPQLLFISCWQNTDSKCLCTPFCSQVTRALCVRIKV